MQKHYWILAAHITLIVSLFFCISVLGMFRGRVINTGFGIECDVRTYIVPMKISELGDKATPLQIYNWMEKDYQYALDDETLSISGVILKESTDYWIHPQMELRVIRQTGHFVGDCEDGAVLLASLLRGYGYTANVAVGTVEIGGRTYGHAWVILDQNGTDFLLETILGEQMTQFLKVGDPRIEGKYHAQYVFNDTTSRDIIFGGAPSSYPNIPPNLIAELKNLY